MPTRPRSPYPNPAPMPGKLGPPWPTKFHVILVPWTTPRHIILNYAVILLW